MMSHHLTPRWLNIANGREGFAKETWVCPQIVNPTVGFLDTYKIPFACCLSGLQFLNLGGGPNSSSLEA